MLPFFLLFRCVLKAAWRHLGIVLTVSCRQLGSGLEESWGGLEESGGLLGVVWKSLGVSLMCLEGFFCISLRLLGGTCWFFSRSEVYWKPFGGVWETS